MWIATNDERYAHNAATIIDSWSTQNKAFQGQNAPLVRSAPHTAASLQSLCRSLEVIESQCAVSLAATWYQSCFACT